MPPPRAAVDHVHHRTGSVPPESPRYHISGIRAMRRPRAQPRANSRAGRSHRVPLVLRPVEFEQRLIDFALRGGVEPSRAPARGSRSRLAPRQRPCRRSAWDPVALFDRFVRAGRRARSTIASSTAPKLVATCTTSVGLPRESSTCALARLDQRTAAVAQRVRDIALVLTDCASSACSRGNSSFASNQIAISLAALSGESLPWTRLRPIV